MNTVHFGAGNIGRGFIGEVLNKNGFSITFVDTNAKIIDALNQKHGYTIEYANDQHQQIEVTNVQGINNQFDEEAVIAAIEDADLITTAIGPNILPMIAPLLAKAIQNRKNKKIEKPIDIIACENMIGGSQYLFQSVRKYLETEDLAYVERLIGFPNAAVDRIVPLQNNEDPLFVTVEPFNEWIVEEPQMKAPGIKLSQVHYVENLQPYIERKLLSVNTGHAAVAYAGYFYGYKTIGEAMTDPRIQEQLRAVLQETGSLLQQKWHFPTEQHDQYIEKIMERFGNPNISDDIKRVARNPIQKLGSNERFMLPIKQLKELDIPCPALLETLAMILLYNETEDKESQKLQQFLHS